MNKLLIVAILIILVIPINGQNSQFGVTGGIMIADMDLIAASGEEYVTNSRTAFGIGFVYERLLMNNIGVVIEPMYLQKGGQQKATNDEPNIDIMMNFVELPIFFKMTFGETIKPYVKIGPSIGFQVNSKAETEVGGVVGGSALQTYEGDLTDVIGRIDIGLGIGGGFGFVINDYTLYIDGRYTLGLLDIWKGGTIEWENGGEKFEVESNEDGELKTKGIQIMIGLLLPPK